MSAEETMEIHSGSPISFSYLKKFNLYAGVLHLITGILMLFLGLTLEWEQDVYTIYLNFEIIPPDTFIVQPTPTVLFTLTNIGVILASFPLMSALAHFLIAYPLNDKYVANLKKGMNPYRWYEYSVSSSVMIFLITFLLGIWDLWSLVMIVVLNALMIMFGYLMEVLNQYTEKTKWSPFIIGCISGFTPWVVLFGYFTAAISMAETGPPTFVYIIIFMYFFLFNIFALNMVLQYKKVSKWKDYLYGERMYIILSLIAKTLLAWIVFAGIFAPF
ncbi:MAG: heliorhodopsin HeR [Candidatus Thorarchaeota archaeon]|nr:heliorhodopsin HeR [Candidatus Thorarchaeota archaeon]